MLRGDPSRPSGSSRRGRDGSSRSTAARGSASALLAAGLVDTLRLVVAPTVIGAGRRLLDHPSAPAGLRLVRHEVTTNGLLLLEYECTGAAPAAEYEGVTAFV